MKRFALSEPANPNQVFRFLEDSGVRVGPDEEMCSGGFQEPQIVGLHGIGLRPEVGV
jgi:hypothetical protein